MRILYQDGQELPDEPYPARTVGRIHSGSYCESVYQGAVAVEQGFCFLQDSDFFYDAPYAVDAAEALLSCTRSRRRARRRPCAASSKILKIQCPSLTRKY